MHEISVDGSILLPEKLALHLVLLAAIGELLNYRNVIGCYILEVYVLRIIEADWTPV